MRMTNRGFTLIELLVVVAIIGILSSIAIPAFSDYKKKAYNSAAQSDLRNGMTSQEAYWIDNETYSTTLSGLEDNGFVLSENVLIYPDVATDEVYVLGTAHTKGDKIYCYGYLSNTMSECNDTAGDEDDIDSCCI